ncbi:hypothetical protein HDU86_001370 [Geranomyces michiganensis]|nr:hypothetical protein HDU86_001370 [Geranomyces michiganensis]
MPSNLPPEPRIYLWGLPPSKSHSLLSESLHLLLKRKYKRLHAVHIYHGSDRAHLSYTNAEKLKQDVRATPRSWIYVHKGKNHEITGVPKLAKIGVLAVTGLPKNKSVNSTWHLPGAPWTVISRSSSDVTLIYFTEALAALYTVLQKKKTVAIDGVKYKVNKVEMPASIGDDDDIVADAVGTVAPACEGTTHAPWTMVNDLAIEFPHLNGDEKYERSEVSKDDGTSGGGTPGNIDVDLANDDDNDPLSDGLQALFNEVQDENDALRDQLAQKESELEFKNHQAAQTQHAYKERFDALRAELTATKAEFDQKEQLMRYTFAERFVRKEAELTHAQNEIAKLHRLVGELHAKSLAVPPPPPPPPPPPAPTTCPNCVISEGITAHQADEIIALQLELANLRTSG